MSRLFYLLPAAMLALAGCATPSATLHYYSLSLDNTLSQSRTDERDQHIVLERLKLADYLQQSYLVLQTGDNQLHFAKQHLWAEPVADGVQDRLLTVLNQKQSNAQLIGAGMPGSAQTPHSLQVQIRQLLPSHQGTVNLHARYWLTTNTGEVLQEGEVRLSQSLRRDGYPEAIRAMGAVVDELADTIAADIATLD